MPFIKRLEQNICSLVLISLFLLLKVLSLMNMKKKQDALSSFNKWQVQDRKVKDIEKVQWTLFRKSKC